MAKSYILKLFKCSLGDGVVTEAHMPLLLYLWRGQLTHRTEIGGIAALRCLVNFKIQRANDDQTATPQNEKAAPLLEKNDLLLGLPFLKLT